MYRSRNQNCYCNCYCNWKIFHFGRMLWSWNYHCCHWFPWVRLSSRALLMFLRYASIPVRHIFTGTCTSPCFREYFSLGGCAGLVSYNIFGYFRVYFTLGGCTYVIMSNAICGGVVTLVSLELARWYCWEGLFRLVLFLGLTTDRSPPRS